MKLSQPSTFSDPLTEVLRSGARSLLARAVEAEVAGFLDGHSEARTEEGRRRLVRHGHLPEREIMTGIGPVAVRAPRVRDRTGQGAERIRFSSALLPPYARRSKSLEVLIPVLYLKGISTGDFAAALAALLGPDAGGLSASTVARLTEVWADQHAHWLKRDLSARHYVYFWADGIHVQARLEDDAQCLLVIIGATPEGKKELVGLIDGVRESAQSWRELLLDLKRRGLAVAPELAIADGALGFWKAIEDVWPRTRSQRCWVHKTANVLNKLPKSQHSKAKRALQEIWMAETRNDADSAFDAFIETDAVKYDKAAACLVKDRATMLAFYDFPAEHWKHLRTTNPIESTVATVRHLAEFGVVVPQGVAHVGRLALALEDPGSGLPEPVRELGGVLLGQIADLDAKIGGLEKELRACARQDEQAARLMTIPGIGPISAMALQAFAPPMESFRRSRDFSAWLGLVPRQHTTGGKPRLGRISKMGQRDLRRLLIVGAMAVVSSAVRRGETNDPWLARMLARKPRMLVAMALANKMARIVWALMTRKETYRGFAPAAA